MIKSKPVRQSFIRVLGKGSYRIISIFSILFSIAALVTAIVVGVHPTINKFGLYQPSILIFFLAGVVVIISIIFASGTVNERSKLAKYYPFLVIMLLVAMFTSMVMLGHSLRSYGYTWDSEIIFNAAHLYAVNGSVTNDSVAYLRNYPNNIALFTILVAISKASIFLHLSNPLTLAIAVNIATMFTALVILFLAAKLLYGRRIAVIALLFGFVLIGLSMYVQIPYTDTLTTLFPILLIYLAILFSRSNHVIKRIIFAALIGITTAVGTLIKPTVLIAFVALLLVGIICMVVSRRPFKDLKTQSLTALAVIPAALIVYVGYVSIVNSLHVLPSSVTQASSYSMPPIHYINIGLKSHAVGYSRSYGGYDQETVNKVSLLPAKQDKIDFSTQSIHDQLDAYGPIGYSEFILKKYNWIMSDATFYAYGQGDNDNVVYTSSDGYSQFIRQFTTPSSQYYLLFGNFLQVFWIGIIMLIGMQAVLLFMRDSSRSNLYMLIPRVMIAGIVIFLLIFEARSRYILLYAPVFILLAMYTLYWYQNSRSHDSTEEID